MAGWTKTAKKGGDFEGAPAGNHPAVLVAIIALGTQEQTFQGETKWSERAYFCWELVSAPTKSGGNFVIGIDLTTSLNEKAKLRKWIEARAGRAIPEGVEYDISKELGKPCLLNVVEKGGYSKIESVAAVPTGMMVAKPNKPLTLISLEDFQKGTPIPEWIPWSYGEKLADIIPRCEEIAGAGETPTANGKPVKGEVNVPDQKEEIPF